MGRIEFFEPMRIPDTTHNALEPGLRKNGKPCIRKSARLHKAEDKWEAHLAKHAPESPLEGPLMANVKYCYEPDKLHPEGTPKITPPDGDNLDKTVRDAMQRVGFFVDDAQIADAWTTKGYAHPEGIYVRIETIGEDDEQRQ